MHSPQFAHAHRRQHVVTTHVRTLEHSFVYVYIPNCHCNSRTIVLLSYCCSGDCQLCVVPAALLNSVNKAFLRNH